MRDILKLPINDSESLIIASDNSGGIGMKELDVVHVPYEVVAYYSFRVAVMECMAAGAWPITVVLHNFCGEKSWEELNKGVLRGQQELGIDIPITGSTESNIPMGQSALGTIVIGKQPNVEIPEPSLEDMKVAVIGLPFVGNEVMGRSGLIAPLALLKAFYKREEFTILPVGSKGIAYEWNLLQPGKVIPEAIINQVDINKSAGPSTCFLLAYPKHLEREVIQAAGEHFYGS